MTLKEKLFNPIDMTKGNIVEKISLFTIPMIIGNIAQQLYATVDTIIVGHYVGDNALSAVGSAAPVFNLLLVLFMGVATGASILVAQYFGAKDSEGLSKTIGNCITLIIIASIILMIFSPLVIRPLLVILDTPNSIIDWCHDYLLIMS